MPSPKEVFDDPLEYLDFLQSADFEREYFDWKEVKTDNNSQIDSLKKNVKECISAFANTNRQGGLVVLGIADDGTIIGTQHVNEQRMNNILQVVRDLRNHATQTQDVELPKLGGKRLHLLYTPWTPNAICETISDFPKAWKRVGAQNLPLTEQEREQLKRDKRIVDFETSYCCPYDPAELDNGVVEVFKEAFLKMRGAQYGHSTEDILYHAGALIKDESNNYVFTNAGYLFFASNPRKRFGSAFVRLLRYDVKAEELRNRGGMTLDKDFDGPLPNIIRDLRTFLKDSALFRTFSKRNPNGGFTDEPEYPFIVVDEALVNAIVHREYAVTTPTFCIVYRDKLEVRNPGNIPQQVPEEFTLDETTLDPVARNSKIVEWMRIMRDERGSIFVHGLSEGTRTMRDEMKKLGLPPPHYQTDQYTTVTLYSKFDERLGKYAFKTVTQTQEYANLFLLEQSKERMSRDEFIEIRGNILTAIKDALLNHKWFIDRFAFGRIVAHRQGNPLPLSPQVKKVAQIYSAYELQVRQYAENLYLCIDYKVELKNILKVNSLLDYFTVDDLIGKHAVAKYSGQWERGKILEIDSETTKLALSDLDTEVNIPNNDVIPSIGKTAIKRILAKKNIAHDLEQKIKEHALVSKRNAAKTRAEKTIRIVQHLADEIFPIKVNNLTLTLTKIPVPLKTSPPGAYSKDIEPLTVFHESEEPSVEFYNDQVDTNIVDGLAKYSSYGTDRKNIELIPICTPALRGGMQKLISRLKHGKYKYRGSEWTFRTKLSYRGITEAPIEEFENECRRLLEDYPKWAGSERLNRLFLVYVPEDRFPITDLNSPYYTIKELLLSKGIPVQMVDTPTLKNADWKDFNLALNITAKCGVVPWVLPGALPDANFFVGLSYTQHPNRKIDRHMAFANVFSDYGRWQFYQGNAKAFHYDERHEYYKDLVRSTLERLDLRESPSIHFHYSSKFSRKDIEVILEAAKLVRPNGKYTFVWINNSHIVKFYDPSLQTDGSLHRGKYVIGSPSQFYLSTTGYNTYHKALGTPHPLEVNVWTEPYDPSNPPDLKVIAKQLISLTKLNWASTRSFCGTPITIKYARDIARFASAFIERNGKFDLHEVLEKTPWFI